MDHRIEWTDERPTEPGEYWLSIEPGKRQETREFLLLSTIVLMCVLASLYAQ